MAMPADKRLSARDQLLARYVVRPAAGSAEERAQRVRELTSGLRAGVKVTKAMYRPGASR